MVSRAVASDVSVQFGPLSCEVKLYSFRPDRESNNLICPVCAGADEFCRTEQFYRCKAHPDDHGPFKESELWKGRDTEAGPKVLGSGETVKAAMATDANKTLALSCHLASEFEGLSYEAGPGSDTVSYVISPHKTSPMPAILGRLVGRDGRLGGSDGVARVLVGELFLHGTWKLFMVRVWNGNIILHQVARPGQATLATVEALDVEDRYVALAAELFEAETVPFTAESYPDRSRAALDALIASRPAVATVATLPATASVGSIVDLTEALERAVAAAKKAKVPARKRTAKRQPQTVLKAG